MRKSLRMITCGVIFGILAGPVLADLSVDARATLVDPPQAQIYNTGDPQGAMVDFSSGTPTDVKITGGNNGQQLFVSWDMHLEKDDEIMTGSGRDQGTDQVALNQMGEWSRSATLTAATIVSIGNHVGRCFSDIYIVNIADLQDTATDSHDFTVVFE